MMKYAPGKWTVNKYDNGFSIYAGHFRCVAERFEVDPSPERLAMHIANATLMAEAPVLLAACETAMAVFEDSGGDWDAENAHKMLKAASARAKGE